MQLYFIRHGATKGNQEKRYVGSTDEELTEAAVLQLETHRLEHSRQFAGIDVVVVSPMKRCVQTADILFPGKKQIVVEDLRECDFGEFEYRNFRELDGNPWYQRFIDSMGMSGFPGGEDRKRFQERCVRGFERIMPELTGHTEAAFVVHGGTIMALFDRCSEPHGDYYDWQIGPGEGFVTEGVPVNDASGSGSAGWKFTDVRTL